MVGTIGGATELVKGYLAVGAGYGGAVPRKPGGVPFDGEGKIFH